MLKANRLKGKLKAFQQHVQSQQKYARKILQSLQESEFCVAWVLGSKSFIQNPGFWVLKGS